MGTMTLKRFQYEDWRNNMDKGNKQTVKRDPKKDFSTTTTKQLPEDQRLVENFKAQVEAIRGIKQGLKKFFHLDF